MALNISVKTKIRVNGRDYGSVDDPTNLNRAVLILPAVLLLAGGLWLGLAVKTLRNKSVVKRS